MAKEKSKEHKKLATGLDKNVFYFHLCKDKTRSVLCLTYCDYWEHIAFLGFKTRTQQMLLTNYYPLTRKTKKHLPKSEIVRLQALAVARFTKHCGGVVAQARSRAARGRTRSDDE